jgi:hypothetical protein
MNITRKQLVVTLCVAGFLFFAVWFVTNGTKVTPSTSTHVAQILPVKIIEDAVVRTATKNWLERVANEWDSDLSGAAFAARQAKYAYDLLPKFGNEAKLYDATYAVYSDSGSGTEWRLKEAKLPTSTIGFLSNYRETLFSRLRGQLKDPKVLDQLYHEKKQLILAEIMARPELKEKVLDFLREAGNTFTAVASDKDKTSSYVASFARRRMTEGGVALVWEYSNLCDDLYESIK